MKSCELDPTHKQLLYRSMSIFSIPAELVSAPIAMRIGQVQVSLLSSTLAPRCYLFAIAEALSCVVL